jgi:hypothetical protein
MEKELTPETYELAERELAKIKHTCEISQTIEPALLAALLHYYDMKKENPDEATRLWGKVQHILDSCPLKHC